MSDETVGFVLAGGGFKGAFELGALQHLIGTCSLVPQVITATSAGAVLGTVVSQGRDTAECRRRLVEAEGDLMAMTRTDVVFAEQPWLAQLDGTSASETIHRLVTQHGRPDLDDDWDELEAEALEVLDGMDVPSTSAARRRRHHFEQVAVFARGLAGGRKLEHGLPRAVLNLGPFEEAIRGRRDDVGIATVDPALVARPGIELRLAVTALRQRQTALRHPRGPARRTGRTHHGARRPGRRRDRRRHRIGQRARRVPAAFARLGDHYVDGGRLQNIPLRARSTWERPTSTPSSQCRCGHRSAACRSGPRSRSGTCRPRPRTWRCRCPTGSPTP